MAGPAFLWFIFWGPLKKKFNKQRCAWVICQHWDFMKREWAFSFIHFYLLILGLGKGAPINSNLRTCQMIRGKIPALLEQSQSSMASEKTLAPSCWAMMSLGASLRPWCTQTKLGSKNDQENWQAAKKISEAFDTQHMRSWEQGWTFSLSSPKGQELRT